MGKSSTTGHVVLISVSDWIHIGLHCFIRNPKLILYSFLKYDIHSIDEIN